ncbi:MAG: metallophosphoesterase [Bryobacteraceae bacterium]
MTWFRIAYCCILSVTLAGARNLTPAWIELGPDGQTLARIVVEAGDTCPALSADGSPLAMQRREPVPEGFEPACEAVVPAATRALRFEGRALPLPSTPKVVAVLGDTGCRVSAKDTQNCANPELWPFRKVADRIARLRPDLIVHVGDYLYREVPCPDEAKGCKGPHGDNWAAWDADFFSAAHDALAAAPWAFSRGNHETCARSWQGWFYYLDPRPFTNSCIEYSEPYIAHSGTLRIGMMDSAPTKEDEKNPRQIAHFAGDLRTFSGKVDWIADHHPFWAYKTSAGKKAKTQTLSQPLAAAWDQARPEGIRMILSGHIHLFEFLAFDALDRQPGNRPAQLVAGTGGTNLAVKIKPNLAGETVFGVAVNTGNSEHEFGYTELDRRAAGWDLEFRNSNGADQVDCTLPDRGNSQCRAPHSDR